MKLESLKLEKFKSHELKKEQMFALNGGGTRTNVSGTNLCHYSNGQWYLVDYSYDIQRVDENGQSFTTYHGFTNWRHALEDC